jgi:hypothetical protein
MLWENAPRDVEETTEKPEFYDACKGVSSSVYKSTTGKVTKPTLSDPANTRAVDFFANPYFYDDSQDAMNPAWAQLRTQTFGDQSVLEVLRPLKSQADLEKYFRVAINCWENVLDYTDLVPIRDRLDRQQRSGMGCTQGRCRRFGTFKRYAFFKRIYSWCFLLGSSGSGKSFFPLGYVGQWKPTQERDTTPLTSTPGLRGLQRE